MNFLKREFIGLPVWAWGLGGLAFLIGIAYFLRQGKSATGTGTVTQSGSYLPVPYPTSSGLVTSVTTPSQQVASNFNIRLPGSGGQGAQISQQGPDQSGGYTVTALNVTPELGMLWGSVAPRANPTEVWNFINQLYSTYGLGQAPSRGTFVAYGVGGTLQRFPFWSDVAGPGQPQGTVVTHGPVFGSPTYTSSQSFGSMVGPGALA